VYSSAAHSSLQFDIPEPLLGYKKFGHEKYARAAVQAPSTDASKVPRFAGQAHAGSGPVVPLRVSLPDVHPEKAATANAAANSCATSPIRCLPMIR
jgi:hypothetical protein